MFIEVETRYLFLTLHAALSVHSAESPGKVGCGGENQALKAFGGFEKEL